MNPLDRMARRVKDDRVARETRVAQLEARCAHLEALLRDIERCEPGLVRTAEGRVG